MAPGCPRACMLRRSPGVVSCAASETLVLRTHFSTRRQRMSLRRQQIVAIGCGLGLALISATSNVAAQQATTLQLNQQNNSGISGTATFTPSGGGLSVDLKVTGAGAVPQPDHIHGGTFAQLNPTPEFTLASVTNGCSTTTLQTTLQALA